MRKSIEEVRGVVQQQELSGQSAAEFCRQQGLSEKKFYVWRQRAKRPDGFARIGTDERIELEISGIKVGVLNS